MQTRFSARIRFLTWFETLIALLAALLCILLILSLAIPRGVFAQASDPLFIPFVTGGQGSGGSAQGAIIPGRYIVVLAGTPGDGVIPAGMTATQRAESLAETYGGAVVYTYEAALTGFAVELTDAAVAALQADPQVAFIEPDRVMQIDVTQSNPPWGLDRIDQRALPLNRRYEYTLNGAGVHAYVVDTGVRTSHVEFRGRIGPGFTTIYDGRGVSDCNGHGTHVAATLGGTTYGVAKRVTIHPVRVLGCNGSGSTSGVIAGIDWITRYHQRPAVANLSLGGAVSAVLDTAIRASIAAGVTFVVAAGNANADACNTSPARVAEALTVAATSSSDARASFSNYGRCVDLFAPGVAIVSALAGSDAATGSYSGTSMASPHVAGAAALYLSGVADASPAQVFAAIINGATENRVSNAGALSPNRLLYTPALQGAPQPLPTATATSSPTPSPTPFPTATPSPTPTATPTVTPTSAPGNTPTPTATPPVSGCEERVINGGFEAGATAWTQRSSQGFPLICSEGVCGSGLHPYSGAWLGWLGGANRERSLLSQTLTIPGGQPATLRYQARIESEDTCGYDFAYVNVRVGTMATTVRRIFLCRSANSNGWIQQAIDVSKYAGKQIRLDFYVTTDAWNVSSFFVDEVSLRSGASCTNVIGTGMEPVTVDAPLELEFHEEAGAEVGATDHTAREAAGSVIWRR